MPKHKNPTHPRVDRDGHEHWASAPYNFIPLPERVVPDVDKPDDLPDHDTYADPKFKHTGYFDVTLTTKSPLYVRCALTESQFEQAQEEQGHPESMTDFRRAMKNKPEFFHTRQREEPVIPGSSLRGMLRSVLEIVSYSKMSQVANKRLVYRAVGDTTSLGVWYRNQMLGENQGAADNLILDYPSPQLKGGYLCLDDQGNWAIRPAKQDQFDQSFVHVDYARIESQIGGRGRQLTHPVWIRPMPNQPSPRPPRPSRGRPIQLTLNLAESPEAKPRNGTTPPAPGMLAAVLVESGHMGKKMGERPNPHQKHWHCAVYEENTEADPIAIPKPMWDAYVEDRDMNRGIKTRPLEKERDALFYLLDENNHLVFFGPTMMFRLPYQRSIHDLIPRPLRESPGVDFAEALFGYVRDRPMPDQAGKARAYASRVFVTEATLKDKNVPAERLWLTGDPDDAVAPRILATPKPTAFQHYLTQPDETRGELSHYDSPTEDEDGTPRGHRTVIRGHKVYWHRGDRSVEAIRAKHSSEIKPGDDPVDWHGDREFERDRNQKWRVKPGSKQYTQFKPVKSNISFRGQVYFENVSDEELGALCWMLTPFGDETKTYCHSLGMGKALGMGAVKLDTTLYLTQRETRYGALFSGNAWQTGATGEGEALADRATLVERVKPFEQHVLSKLELEPEQPHLAQVRRIGMLLKMLEWEENPPVERARPVLTDTFKERPVLPDPAFYAPELDALAVPASANSPVEKAPAETLASPLALPKAYAVGAVFNGKVLRLFESGDVAIQVPRWPQTLGYAYIYAADRGAKRYAVGNDARCQVIQIITAADKRTVLICKPGTKAN